jgi:hypothetical protein
MVYGLNVQPEWGFGPKVDWEGQDEYPARAIPALNPVNDGGVNGDSYHAGLAVDGANFPKWVKWSDPNGNPVPDFDVGPFLNVSEKAKTVIEGLEPSVHQFFPVEYQDHKGRSWGTRYWFVPCNRLDTVNGELSNMVLGKWGNWRPVKDLVRRGEPIPDYADPKKPSKLVFNVESVGDHHVWRDKRLDSGPWISDKMADALKRAALTGLRLDEDKAEQVE